MRILICCEYGSINGGENSLLAVLPGLRDAGCELVIASPADGPLAPTLRDGGFEWIELAFTSSSQTHRRETLERLLLRVRPQVVHSNSLSMSRLVGPVAQRLAQPSIGHLRDILKLSRRAIDDLNANTRLLAVSQATREFHVAAGLDPQRTWVVYNGVDTHRFRPAAATGWLHRELGLPPRLPLLGSIGQIGLRKGWDVWLTAAESLLESGVDAAWIMVGQRYSEKEESVQYEQRLRKRAASGALAGRCFFLGRRHDVPALLSEWTLLIHPARQEPLGRVLLEAAAAGIPVVATDVGGTREIFSDNRQARLVPVDHPAALTAAVEQLLRDRNARQRQAAAARTRIVKFLQPPSTIAALLEHYRQVH